jgi:hypothetical protein
VKVEKYASFYPHSAWMLFAAGWAKLLSFDHLEAHLNGGRRAGRTCRGCLPAAW